MLLSLVSSVHSDEKLLNQTYQNFIKNTRKFKLKNGLRVILHKRDFSPTLSLYIKIGAGSSVENETNAGTAHLLEHMLFKGTQSIGTKDWNREKKYQDQIESWGEQYDLIRIQELSLTNSGQKLPEILEAKKQKLWKRIKALEDLQREMIVKNEDNAIYEINGQVGFNAYTSSDVTNYQISLPKNRMELWAKIESDRLMQPILREYYTERDVILEEKKMRLDNVPSARFRAEFLQKVFQNHPYQKPVIGYEKTIPYLRISDTKAFFKEHYSPENIVICIVGDLNFQDASEIVEKYFSGLSNRIETAKKEVKITAQKGGLIHEHTDKTSPMVMIGFHRPEGTHPDNIKLEILSSVLGSGKKGRLYKRLVLDEKIAYKVGVYSTFPGEKKSSLFFISVELNKGTNPTQAEKIIWEEINKIKTTEITADEITTVKNTLLIDLMNILQKNAGLADLLSHYEIITGNWENLFLDSIKTFSAEQKELRIIAEKYFTRENSATGLLREKQ